MTIDDILELVRLLPGSLVLSPEPGGAYPRIAWGDHFFHYAPDGQVPQRTQPYATIVTKDYPDDCASRLDVDGRWRVNVRVPRERFAELLGRQPRTVDFDGVDLAAVDTVLPHPVYAHAGLVSVVNPGKRTEELVAGLLRDAHHRAMAAASRRAAT
ncbi:DUF6194 family protein [Prauserella rugosa]|uniref:DUF6194 domain-containing protein n=1 Tax=Prauserella rugosa TaxID=43354 RepID=A0A660CE55_9PSEU|nr:DUF6194 family protein [Prauserella rugosa]KMS86008.1 hypothetical protein ACZ91_39225 [Streptomyces regensis]TWH21672.1 hypothetical protein JD82_03538 [Prauserella rugosa]